jgi:hypothetical protein
VLHIAAAGGIVRILALLAVVLGNNASNARLLFLIIRLSAVLSTLTSGVIARVSGERATRRSAGIQTQLAIGDKVRTFHTIDRCRFHVCTMRSLRCGATTNDSVRTLAQLSGGGFLCGADHRTAVRSASRRALASAFGKDLAGCCLFRADPIATGLCGGEVVACLRRQRLTGVFQRQIHSVGLCRKHRLFGVHLRIAP